MVVLTTGKTSTTGMFPVLSDTSVTGRHMTPVFSGVGETGRHLVQSVLLLLRKVVRVMSILTLVNVDVQGNFTKFNLETFTVRDRGQ